MIEHPDDLDLTLDEARELMASGDAAEIVAPPARWAFYGGIGRAYPSSSSTIVRSQGDTSDTSRDDEPLRVELAS